MPSNIPAKEVGNPPERTVATSEASTPSSTWKLEDSSIWWLSYFWDPGKSSGWLNNPGNILLITSLPFFAGAYFGCRIPTERLEDLIQGSVGDPGSSDGGDKSGPKMAHSKSSSGTRTSASAKAVDQDAIRAVAARTASRALRVATLGTVGTFGLVGAIGFYMSGYESLEKAVVGTTRWASSWGKSLEHAMGGDQAVSKTHPEVMATKELSGEEEWSYIYDKYIKEEVDEDKDTLWQDNNDPEKEKDALPTLYSIYEKYFKKKEND